MATEEKEVNTIPETAQPSTSNPTDAEHNSVTSGTDGVEDVSTGTSTVEEVQASQTNEPETVGVTALIDPAVAPTT